MGPRALHSTCDGPDVGDIRAEFDYHGFVRVGADLFGDLGATARINPEGHAA